MRPPHKGPSLPQSLLEEIGSAAGQGGRKSGRGKGLSRKEARQQERYEKKQKKLEFFSGGRTQGAKRPASDEHVESPRRKKQKLDGLGAPKKTRKDASKSGLSRVIGPTPSSKRSETSVEPKARKQKTALQKLADGFSGSHSSASKSQSKSSVSELPRRRKEEEEDAYIAYLESKLGWKKGGKKSTKYGKGLEEDGLDELLMELDQIESSVIEDALTRVNEEDMDTHGSWSEQEISEGHDSDEVDEDESPAEEGNEEESDPEEEQWNGIGDDDVEPSDEAYKEVTEEDEPETKDSPPSLADQHTPTVKYIPPHLRNRPAESSEESEAKLKLTRHLKGQLNRMSEQNIGSIIDAVEEIYRNHRRHDVTSTITSLIVDGISAHSILLDSYVVLHAAFVSALHKLIGIEFAAYFVQTVVASYERHFAAVHNPSATTVPTEPQNVPETRRDSQQQQGTEVQGKEASNLIVLLSELYNFQVISCVLVYDIIRGLLGGDLSEFKVELLLKIARNSGQQLRSDDPSALKDIIQIVQSKLPEDKANLSSRTKYMVETLTNLKNNKLRKTAAGQEAGKEAVERMKKWLSGLTKKRHVRTHEPLRVTLDDLHSAETKGKWWLVGAAWGGDPLVDRQQDGNQTATQRSADTPSENVLLKLARKQGMNTDIRRSIFIVLMSSEDYVHACDRLSQLKLTEVQQRDIIRVILHCCGNEQAYNPYYTLIGQHLCRLSVSHKFTLQYCLWDFLRDLGETNVRGAEIIKNLRDGDVGFDLKNISSTRMTNIARAYGWWIAKDCITLAILKPVDFTTLKSQSRRFLVHLLIHVFISAQLSTPLVSSDPKDIPQTRNRGPLEEVFIKATKIRAVALGLMYFLGEVVMHEVEQIDNSGFLTWANKIALDTLKTSLEVVPTL